METLFALAAEKLSGWDFLVAGIIVLIVEFVVSVLLKNASEKAQGIVKKLAPIVLGGVFYLVLSFVQGGVWYTALAHGLFVGLAAMGSYDVILKTIKDAGKKSIQDINDAVKKAIEEDK